MTDAPERIWATGNGETGSWNAIEGRMKSHMPDGWQTEYVRATDYDALAAKLAKCEARLLEVEAERDKFSNAWVSACLRSKTDTARAEAAEAALPAVYRLALEDAADAINKRGIYEQECFGLNRATQNFFRARDIIRALPTLTAAKLMARIKETGQ